MMKLWAGALGFLLVSSSAFSADWTIMIYMNGDNDLEKFAFEDLRELEAVGSTDNVNVIVQLDQYYVLGTQRFRIEKKPNPRIVEDMPEQDMGDYNTLIDFLDWGVKKYPADHYAVIVWNHGSGWKKEEDESQIFKGVSYDESSGHRISTDQISFVFDKFSKDIGKPLDILAFDACLMAMMEIADGLASSVNIMVSSEEVIPGLGFPYDKVLEKFYAGAGKEPKNLATTIVEQYAASYMGGSQGTTHFTLSAIDLTKFQMLKDKFNDWVRTIQGGAGLEHSDFMSAAKETLAFEDSDFRDLGNYVSTILDKRLSKDQMQMSDAKKSKGGFYGDSFSLLNAIDSVMIRNLTSKKFSRARGISIYLPYVWEKWSPWISRNERDQKLREEYRNLSFSRTTSWTGHLDQLFGTVN